MKLTRNETIERINDLLANNNKQMKYISNYKAYNQTPSADLKAKIPMPVGTLDSDIWSDDATVPKLNIVKSAIDSVVSQITTAKCRPFVNTIKGSFKTIQIAKQLQMFLDYYYDEMCVAEKMTEMLRNACIFDSSYLYIDEKTGSLEIYAPWNVYVRQVEKDEFRSAYIETPNKSNDMLSDEEYSLLKQTEKKALYNTVGYFYDARTKTKATLINRQIRKIEETEFDTVPLLCMRYGSSVVGNSNLSIADMLRGNQKEIDVLMKRMAEASVLNPAMSIFVPNASNIKVGQLNNSIGNIIQYDTIQGSSVPQVVTPDFISDQYTRAIDFFIEKSYNMVGISQLTAMSVKPQGLDSGIALATLNDIQSNRFQTVLDNYISSYTKLARLIFKVFSKKKSILEPNRYSLDLTWKDVEGEYDKMRIQFSSADALSKDPSEKLKQLQALAAAGIIPATQIASLLELPDIQRGYNVANNAYNATMTLIDQVIYEDKYEIPDYVPFQMIKEQIVNMQLNLRAASVNGSNDEDIERLTKYFTMIEEKENEMTGGEQTQSNVQDTNTNNMYSVQNNENLTGGAEHRMTMENENVANPYATSVANENELSAADMVDT